MGFFSKIFDKPEKPEKMDKKPMPEAYQVQILMNQFSVEQLKKLTQDYTLLAHHWNLIANSYKQFQEYDLAEKAYLKAIELDKTNEDHYGNLLALYIKTDNYTNYENIYSAGMANANPRSYIVLKDGMYHYKQKNYDMAHSAALSVLTAKQMQDENAFILAVTSLFSWALEIENKEEVYEKFMEGIEMLRLGLIVFPNSEHLNSIKSEYLEYFPEE